MIDWKQISEDCPAVFVAWFEFLMQSEPPRLPSGEFLDEIGYLLAFFDEQGVIVVARYYRKTKDFNGLIPSHFVDTGSYKSRPEALAAAFTEAFKILETERVKQVANKSV